MQPLTAARITVLVQTFDAKGVMRFPSDPQGFFGLTRFVEPTLAVSKQAQNIAAKAIGCLDLADRIEPIIAVEPPLKAEGQEPSLLYLMKMDPKLAQGQEDWLRIVDILRALPQGSVRVAYNKAMQVFAGTLHDEFTILEMDEEVRRRLTQLMAENGPDLLK
ncbi:MAG TPA: hypothetical protein VE954_05670 [Oligoflexus sp.]|uniref:hypothetical protein n=1 Tax=Oligoflexus sp. TaxID=1971216 RepID=UPI002D733106|nr:hypothetical protein [Oligoflexus sp.]HYX32580.1 hypothetical protein [Oligoflexus sp.]